MRNPHRRPRRRDRLAVATLLGTALLAGVAACGGDDDASARDDGSEAGSPAAGSTTPDDAATYPPFEPADYVYRLEVLCYCPQVGAVRIAVRDGKVVTARTVGGGRGVEKGAEAPDFARLTINDVIATANDPEVDDVEVTWPDGQAHPSVVEVDHLADAVDDEVTYTIRNVRVTG